MDLEESFAQPVLAHGVLDGRLHLEDQQILRPPKIQEPPVQPDFRIRFLGPRDVQRQLPVGCTLHHQLAHEDLHPAGLDDWILNDFPDDRHRRLAGQGGDRLVHGREALRPLRGRLTQPGVVADDEELHALLIANRADPALDLHLLPDVLAKIFDQRASHPGPGATRRRVGHLMPHSVRRRRGAR